MIVHTTTLEGDCFKLDLSMLDRVSHLVTAAKRIMVGPEGETPEGRGSGKVSAVSA